MIKFIKSLFAPAVKIETPVVEAPYKVETSNAKAASEAVVKSIAAKKKPAAKKPRAPRKPKAE